MNPWGILDIEPTDDTSQIKKAYAKKLKQHHPEDDPEGYQRLREAYDYIMKQQKKNSNRAPSKAYKMNAEANTQSTSSVLTIENQEEELVENQKQLVNDFMNKVEELYHHFPSRIEGDNWSVLLDLEILRQEKMYKAIKRKLLLFLCTHHFLPKKIWVLLEETFHWYEELAGNEAILNERLKHFFHNYKQRLEGPDYSYHFLLDADGLDYDGFLAKKEAAYEAFESADYLEAEKVITRALLLYARDPDLYKIYGETLLRTNQHEEAEFAFSQHMKIHNHSFNAQLDVAAAYFTCHHLDESYKICESLLKVDSSHIDVNLLVGKILYEKGLVTEAEEMFKKVLEINPHQIEAILHIAKIHGAPSVEHKQQSEHNEHQYSEEDTVHNQDSIVENFIEKVKAVYTHFPSRIQIETWQDLLNSDEIWNFQIKGKINVALYNYILEHHFLPKNVLTLLEDTFHWIEELESEEGYLDEKELAFLTYYKRKLAAHYESYKFLKNAGDIDYDRFLGHREAAFVAFEMLHYSEADRNIQEALRIYQYDPDLYRILALSQFFTSRYEEAIDTFNQLLQIDHTDDTSRLAFAEALYKCKRYEESIKHCERLLKKHPDAPKPNVLLGKNLLELGDLEKAREAFKSAKHAEPSHIDAIIHLATVNKMMYEQKKQKKYKRPLIREIKGELGKSSVVGLAFEFLVGFTLRSLHLIFLFLIFFNGFTIYFPDPFLTPLFIPLFYVTGMFEVYPDFAMKMWTHLLIWYILMYWFGRKIVRVARGVRY
ncbi:J domain-containing protein [Metabacillus malikii]|uniref:Tetratricopeptide (TPR) repeat protein n=1 Tax=Metabacillus malikii TaxID=1504265 RepID=A0ABT9ZMV8_9BACI|nr:tetratricopeptide repeat protein [Metabacillus malikii]MDQ0233152.1 tetratricopeptide (TPR) repeat protein [Metabacillus malikii]